MAINKKLQQLRFEFVKDVSLHSIQSENMFMIHPNAADSQISQDDTSVIMKFMNRLCNSLNAHMRPLQ
jgi:hypothetical protein